VASFLEGGADNATHYRTQKYYVVIILRNVQLWLREYFIKCKTTKWRPHEIYISFLFNGDD